MLTSCKYSCWEWYNFRSKSPKYADAAIDRSMDCYQWANQGECGANAVSASPATHADFRAALPPARAIRYLSLSRTHAPHTRLPLRPAQAYMKKNCPQSCKDKSYDPPPPPPSEKKKKKKKKKKASADKDEV